MSESPSDAELIAGYLANYAGDESCSWAYDQVCDLLSDDPGRLWKITLQMIAQAEEGAALAYIAAGPLEDLLTYHGDLFISRVEVLAKSDAHFAEALRGVWGHVRFKPEIYARVQAAAKA